VLDKHFVYRADAGAHVALESTDFDFSGGSTTLDWHNQADPRDTSGDGLVSTLDALLVINELNRHGAHTLPTRSVVRQIDASLPRAYVDVTGDGVLSPSDALTIIHWLNRKAASESPGRLSPELARVAALRSLVGSALVEDRLASRIAFARAAAQQAEPMAHQPGDEVFAEIAVW
jgi:hypothetical protein